MTHLLKIGPRLFANLALTLALFAFVSVTFLNDVAEETEKAETAELLALLEITQSVLADFDSQVTDNTLTLQEAQTRAQQLLNSLRYAETNYFFAFDGDLNVISHGADDTLIGRNMSDVAAPNGALVFADFREAAQNGNGLLDYEWPKPGSDTPVAKLGAAIYFEPWGWYVGTGMYRDHLQAVVAHERSVILWLTIPIGIILLVVTTIITYSIASPIKKLQKRMNELTQGDDTSPVPATKAGGELGAMAKAIADFCETHQRAGEATRAEIARRASDQQAQQAVVAELGSKLHALSKGDMRQRIETVFEAEYDVLRDDFNAAIDQMNKALSSVVLRAAGINDRTSEISNATDSLSVRTESQAATLEQTSAAVQDFTSHVGATAESAENANGYVKKTRQHAETNRKVVSDTEEAMESISKSSGEISKIIQVIDDIAFQTNLLALNAGVEAARAGDAGRGFGVVADEVRALARRSSEAAKEINLLISNSSENVEKGVKLVGRTGKALADIIEMVTEISGLVAGIAKSCQEQTMSLGDINIAVSQLDEVTQSNAAMAEQTNAAGRLLAQDAQSLSALTGQFNLADTSEETSHETDQAA